MTKQASGSNSGGARDELLQSISAKRLVLLPPHVLTITIYIPTNQVGAVIGRRGQNIASIQKVASLAAASGANPTVRVSVAGNHASGGAAPNGTASSGSNSPQPQLVGVDGPNSTSSNVNGTTPLDGTATTAMGGTGSLPPTYTPLDFSDSHWTPIVIRADPAAALTASFALDDMLSHQQQMDDVIVDVPLHRNKHAQIVGKRGLGVAHLSASTAVRIMVPPSKSAQNMVQLEGKLHNVAECLALLLAVASKSHSNNKAAAAAAKSPTPGGDAAVSTTPGDASITTKSSVASSKGGGGGAANANATTTTTVTQTVKVHQLPSQTKLRSVGRKTDTTVKKKKVEDGVWQLIVSGNSEAEVHQAVAIWQKWNEDASSNTNNNGGNKNNSNNSKSNGDNAAGPQSPGGRRGRGGRSGRGNPSKNSPRRGKSQNQSTKPADDS